MMKGYGSLGLLGLIGLSFVFALPSHAQVAPRVVISEINWAGSESSTADEWLELVNLSSEPIDVSNYVLTGMATGGGAIAIAAGTIVPPSQTLLIANYDLSDPKTTLAVAPNLVTTAISLPNTNLNVMLADPDGLVIDSYIDAGAPDFGSTKPAVSVERDLATLLWRASTEQKNLSLATQLGTPGVANVPVATGALQTTETPASTSTVTPTPVVTVETAPTSANDQTFTVPVPADPIVSDTQVTDAPAEPAISEPEPIVETTETATPEVIDIIVQSPVTSTSSDLPPESAETPASTSTVTPTPVVTVDVPTIPTIQPGQLILNEIVSDPIDNLEWVELFNASAETLDLTGAKLVDAGNHTTLLPAQSLAAQSFLVLENPSGNLNNASETITLFDAHDTLLDTLTYGTADIPAPEDGEALARDLDDMWRITTTTRDHINVFPTPTVSTSSSSASESEQVTITQDTNLDSSNTDTLPLNDYETYANTTDSSSSNSGTTQGTVAQANYSQPAAPEPIHRIVAIAKSVDANTTENKKPKTKKSNQQTTITGTVVALPDVFGKQTMFLDGYELYFNAADWPTLNLGDVVRVIGTQSTSNGASRLKISNADNITVISHIEVTPAPLTGADLATTRHGALVTLSGQVIAKDGNKLTVKTNDDTVITVLANKRTNVSWSQIQSGLITLTGIVKHTESGKVIAVRSMDDVQFAVDPVIASVKTPKPKTKTSPLVGGGLLTGTLGALGTWYVRSRTGL